MIAPITACVLYAALAFHFWRTRWQTPGSTKKAPPIWERPAILTALTAHAFPLIDGLFEAGSMYFSFSLALSLMLWLAVAIYWIEGLRSRVEGLQPMVLPLAAMSVLLLLVFPQRYPIAHANNWGFILHFMTAMLAYSLFTLSALHAIFMGLVERKLHHKNLLPCLDHLPPLMTLEAMLFRMVGVAFALLTATLASGLLFSETIFGKAVTLDHKTLFAFASWGIYAALLLGRHIYGWRGRVAVRWTLAGFALLFLAYIGSRFVLEVLLGRIG